MQHPSIVHCAVRRPLRPSLAHLLLYLSLGATVAPLAACSDDDSPTAPVATEQTLALTPTPADRASLDLAISAVDRSWGTMDATQYAANYATDVRFTTPLGALLLGRTGVETGHRGLFGGPYRGSQRTSVVDDILWLAATRVVVERTNDLTGYQFPPPGLLPTLPGVIRTRERLVYERRDGAWTIVRAQLTGVPPTTP